MPVAVSNALALRSKIGDGGVADEAFARAVADVVPALARLREAAETGSLPLLGLPAADDLGPIRAAAARLLAGGATDVVVFGTGGSSLGGQALAQLRDYAVPGLGALLGPPRVHFLDNLDPVTLPAVLARLAAPTTRFVAVSKSGGTGETLLQTAAMLAALKRAGLDGRVPDLVLGLSEPERAGKRNGLRALLEPYGVPFLEHHTGVGGRFSVLTNVGLLPAGVLGLDLAAIRAGAAETLQGALDGAEPAEVAPAAGAALQLAAMREGRGVTVLMAYADRLERFTRWWVQLWAESIGKDGQGSQPVAALGPVDQHSQQQLYLAGPRDKLFTIVTVRTRDVGPLVEAGTAECAGEPAFAGRRIGDFVAAQGLAMIDTFAAQGRPVRRLHLDRLDERTMGALLMHFMLETILSGWAMGIDPFDQPAVEEAKLLAKRYLAEGRG